MINGDLLDQEIDELEAAIAIESENLLAADSIGDHEAAWDAQAAIDGYRQELALIDEALASYKE